jgi:RHS repeat-associated protein
MQPFLKPLCAFLHRFLCSRHLRSESNHSPIASCLRVLVIECASWKRVRLFPGLCISYENIPGVGLMIAALAFIALPSLAQTTRIGADNMTPSPGVGHDYIKMLAETVNPATGSVSLRIQLPTPQTRGITIPYAITYDSGSVLQFDVDPSDQYFALKLRTPFGPPSTVGGSGGGDTFPYLTRISSNIGSHCEQSHGYVFRDTSGTTHSLNLGATGWDHTGNICLLSMGPYGQGTATDGQIYGALQQCVPDSCLWAPAVTFSEQDGTSYYFRSRYSPTAYPIFELPYQIEDRNGNTISLQSDSITYKNTMGQQIPSPLNQPTTSVSVGGLSYGLQYHSETPSYTLNAQQIDPPPSGFYCTYFLTPQNDTGGVHSLSLPNGTSYTFYYGADNPDSSLRNPYGLLSEIIYPDGGWVKYTWKQSDTFSNVAIFAGLGQPPPSTPYPNTCALQYSTPVIATRQVGFGSGGAALTQTFTYATTWDSSNKQWTQKTTNVTTTDNVAQKSQLTVFVYSPAYLSHDSLDPNQVAVQIPVEHTTTIYDWGNTTTPLTTVTKTWGNPLQLGSVQTTYNNSLTSKIIYVPDALLPTEVDEYDFNQTAPSRKTLTTYQTFTGLEAVLIDRPCKVVVQDQSGNPISETDSYYDGSTTLCGTSSGQSTTAVTGLPTLTHDEVLYGPNSPTPRGNLTKVIRSSNVGSSPTTTYLYDETGQRVSMTDPRGNTTTFSYSDSPSGGNTPGQSNAYLTNVTYPTVNSVTIQNSYKYNYVTGNLVSSMDANSQSVGYTYADSLNRLTRADYPDGGATKIDYNDASPSPSITTSQLLQSPGSWKSSVAVRDGMGHVVQSQLTSDPEGTDYVDTTYDGTGLVHTVSNPYRSTSSDTTTFTYDALSRKTIQAQPDGTQQQWCYNGVASGQASGVCLANASSVPNSSWVDYSDEANHHVQRVSDALGRLTAVMEPSGNSPTLETDYGYDALNNLLSVNQKGTSGETPRTRSFNYDSLSQLHCASNPENSSAQCPPSAATSLPSGVVSYTYDANGNLTTKTDARGVVANYSPSQSPIDALNRVTAISYSDGTPTVQYFYDNFSAWGHPHGASIGRLVRSLISGPSGTEDDLYSYDSMGRINHIEGATPSEAGHAAHWTQMEYDLAGNLAKVLYPSGRIVSQEFPGGWLNSVSYAAQSTPYGDINGGTAINTPYISSISYFPDGSPHAINYGNGVKEQLSQNNRLQTCESSALLSPSLGGQTVMDRQYFFSSATGTPCGTVASNNGNIWNIVDGTNTPQGSGQRSQSFTYDSLNRIASWNTNLMAGNPRSLVFSYDSFGNVSQTNGVNMPNINPGYDAKNHMQASSFGCVPSPSSSYVDPNNAGYDLAGNVLCSGAQMYTAQAYIYDAESRIAQVQKQNFGSIYNPAASYSYDGQSNRIRKDQGNFGSQQYTEYVWVNGHVLTEKDQTGVWTDYIYAGGKKIAQVGASDTAIHLHGTADGTTGAASWILYPDPLNGYTFKPGDKLSWRQYQSSTVTGGIQDLWTTCGGLWPLVVADTDGQQVNSGSAQNVWQNRTLDLTALAGCTAGGTSTRFGTWRFTSAGDWDMWFADMALYSSDGSVVPIYFRQSSIANVYYWNSTGVTNPSLTIDTVTVPRSDDSSQSTVAYSLSDHLGTAQMTFSGGGWPVWKGEFSPFGQELDTQFNPDNYKFTGKERDSESGLDYFGARYYGSNIGRWMSPDPSNFGVDIYLPQTWNRYSYSINNPLSIVDRNGLWVTSIHNEIITDSLPGLSSRQISIVQAASYATDYINTVNGHNPQDPEVSFVHGMSDGVHNQDPMQAQQEGDAFIDKNIQEAQDEQAAWAAAGHTGISPLALTKFGNALHTVTDRLSPAHRGNQPWMGTKGMKNKRLAAEHISQELTIDAQTKAAAQRATQALFLRAFGFHFYWEALNQSEKTSVTTTQGDGIPIVH